VDSGEPATIPHDVAYARTADAQASGRAPWPAKAASANMRVRRTSEVETTRSLGKGREQPTPGARAPGLFAQGEEEEEEEEEGGGG